MQYPFTIQFVMKLSFICHMPHIRESPKLAFLSLKNFLNSTECQKYIFRIIFFYCSVHREIIFHLICHMLHIWKSTKLAFFEFKKLQKWHKMAKKDIFHKILFYCSVLHEIVFHLICHMLHIWKSRKYGNFTHFGSFLNNFGIPRPKIWGHQLLDVFEIIVNELCVLENMGIGTKIRILALLV